MNNILLVDDEANILASLKREFLSHKGQFAVTAFTSPLEALECAKTRVFDLVISDYMMPEMDGLTFLKAFQEIQPETTRMVLSGQADQNALIDAINHTRIFRFIGKPLNGVELAGAVAQALSFRRAASENRRLAAVWRDKNGDAAPLHEAVRHYQILVVDDEQNVLNAVFRDLSHSSRFQGLYGAMRREANPAGHQDNHDFRFIVESATSPGAALEQAKRVSYDLVISDYRMPEMNGVAFLEAFREIQPDAARILFSGHADMQTLIDAINRSEIYAFVAKPWNEYDLKNTVTQAIAFRNLILENRRLGAMLSDEERGETP